MVPVRKILFPTDFSEYSEYAFLVASSLARDYGAWLIVLHVDESSPHSQEQEPRQPGGHRAEVAALLEGFQILDPRVYVERRLECGDPAAEILRLAREASCDLVVMGTHGRTGLRRLLMGSVAERVLRQAPCPVLTVKGPVSKAVAAVGPFQPGEVLTASAG
jgi:universal stress protein A